MTMRTEIDGWRAGLDALHARIAERVRKPESEPSDICVHSRYQRWRKAGIWQQVLATLHHEDNVNAL